MALITCADCGKEVSAAAPQCPNCGRPVKGGSVADLEIHGRGEGIFMKGLNCGCAVLIGFVLLIIVIAIMAPR